MIKFDERESKLPKWAQDIIADERRRSALAWPTQARPTPVWAPGTNVYAPAIMEGETVWQAIPTRTSPQKATVKGRHVRTNDRASGSRPEHGRFFATESDALLDMWWSKAEAAADSIYLAQIGYTASQEMNR